MANLSVIVGDLQQQRKRTQQELERLDAAIAALTKGGRNGGGLSRVRRTLSVAARKRIAAAQRARWAKYKKEHKAAA